MLEKVVIVCYFYCYCTGCETNGDDGRVWSDLGWWKTTDRGKSAHVPHS